MATRRAKKERVARTQVRRTVEERNLENKHIYDIDVRRRGLSLTLQESIEVAFGKLENNEI